MDFRDTPEEAAFRDEVRAWLGENLVGEFARIGGGRGTADEEHWDLRMEWERKLGAAGWIGLGWPKEYGGRGATFAQQAIFNEEYVKANAPGRITFFGEGLLGPTLVAHRHRGPEAALPARRSSRPRSCGARATRSPTPAPTWPT